MKNKKEKLELPLLPEGFYFRIKRRRTSYFVVGELQLRKAGKFDSLIGSADIWSSYELEHIVAEAEYLVEYYKETLYPALAVARGGKLVDKLKGDYPPKKLSDYKENK